MKIHLKYYAHLQDQCGCSEEMLETNSMTVSDLFKELRDRYPINLTQDSLGVAINDEFKSWDAGLQDGDTVVFIPPVSGG